MEGEKIEDRGNLVARFPDRPIQGRLARQKAWTYISVFIPTALIYGFYAFLYVATSDNPYGREVLWFHVRWASVLLVPILALIAYMVPTYYRRFFNTFAIYARGISPPFRDVTSIPFPPYVIGWSARRFLRVFLARTRRRELFIPYSQIQAFVKVRGWEDSFVLDIITRNDVRVRMKAPDLEEFYFAGDERKLRHVYELLDEIRRQVNSGNEMVSISPESVPRNHDNGRSAPKPVGAGHPEQVTKRGSTGPVAATELRSAAAWEYAGKWVTILLAAMFLPFLIVLGIEGDTGFLVIWTIAAVSAWAVLYVGLGPLHRPQIKAIHVGEEGLVLQSGDEGESWIPYGEVRRIASGSASTTVWTKFSKHVLGYGFGGDQGDIILQAYRVWAGGRGIDLLEYKTRDTFPRCSVRNIEVYERSARVKALSRMLDAGSDH